MIKTDFTNIKLLRKEDNVIYCLISMNGIVLGRQQFRKKVDGFLSTVKDKNQKIILFLDVYYYEFIPIVRETFKNLRLDYLICGIGEIFGDQVKNNKSLVYSIIANLLEGNKLVLAEKEITLTNYQDIIALIESDKLLHVTDKEVSFYHRIRLRRLVQIIRSFLATTYGSVEIIGTKNELKNRPSCLNLFYELDYNFVNSIKNTVSQVRISWKNIEIKGEKNSDKHFYGGSPAKFTIFRLRNRNILRKTVIDRGYEGNGIPKLKKEVRFIKQIKMDFPKFGTFYPDIYRELDSPKKCFYDMEYFSGNSNVADGIAKGEILPKDFFTSLDHLLKVSIKDVLKPTLRVLNEKQAQIRLYTDKSAKIPLGCFLIGTQLVNELYSKLVKKYN